MNKSNDEDEGSGRRRLAWSAFRGAVSGGVHFLLERIWDLTDL